MPLHLFLVFVAHWMHFILGTESTPKEYHPPVDIPMILAANFGELRTNHFHMGIDIKTNGREGYKLYSIDEGYISRVNVSPYGYGKCVYINHPGGITSVYAHCQKFTGKLAEKIRQIQLDSKSSEIEVYFEPNELKIKKGEVFALSGNSGGSRGPHLHFEIRDTYTEAALNPLHYGFQIKDDVIPNIHQLRIYALDEQGYHTGGIKEYRIFQNGKEATLNNTVQIDPSFFDSKGGIGFAVSGEDQFTDAYNSCGLYGFKIDVNGQTFVQYQLDKIPFEHTRYLNIYTDYAAFRSGKKFHKAFANTSNPLPFYSGTSRGLFQPEKGKTYQLSYEVQDAHGNKTLLKFDLVVGDGEHRTATVPTTAKLYPDSSYSMEFTNSRLEIPRNCTYEPMTKRIFENGNKLFFGSDFYPVQNAFTVYLRPLKDPPVSKQYLVVDGKHALRTSFEDGWLVSESRYFGEISAMADLKAPDIRPLNIRPIIYRKKTSQLIWRMYDGETGLKDYGVWVDGKWEVLEYESKGNYAFLSLAFLADGKHTIRVQAVDYKNNLTEKEYTIEIK